MEIDESEYKEGIKNSESESGNILITIAVILICLGVLSVAYYKTSYDTTIIITDCKIDSMIKFTCDDGQKGYLKPNNYNQLLNDTNCTQLNENGYVCMEINDE